MRMDPRLPTLALGLLLSTSVVNAQEVLPRVSPSTAGLAAEPLDEVSAVLREAVAEGRVAGAVVGVARGGQVAYLESVGLQDVATRTPITERSLFRIYSMTKAVTAVAAMILHEEGRFELSDPVSMYLPDFERVTVRDSDGSTRPPSRAPTVEDLFLHTAGLSHRSSSEYRAAQVRARDITLEQFVDNIVSVPLRADPGQEYRYSAGPTVLGRLVEVWSMQDFDQFVEERVLRPLGMSDTGFMVQPEDLGRFATMYRAAESGLQAYEIERVPFTERPALMEGSVGLVSTVPDFLRFAQMLVDGGRLGGTRILSETTVEQMTQNGLSPAILANRRGGTGWALANVSVAADGSADGVRAGEYGWNGSAGTEFWVDPSTGTILVTMWQSSPANPGRLRQRITGLVRDAIRGTR
jgi:CubicO group peptidase (beta-lactamase class C family)